MHGSGQPVAAIHAAHGAIASKDALRFAIEGMYLDGGSLHCYLRSTPESARDPEGLSSMVEISVSSSGTATLIGMSASSMSSVISVSGSAATVSTSVIASGSFLGQAGFVLGAGVATGKASALASFVTGALVVTGVGGYAISQQSSTLPERVSERALETETRETESELMARAATMHALLRFPQAINGRTTAVLQTTSGRTIVGSGVRDLSPVQRQSLRPNETEARLLGEHAEVTVVARAIELGLQPASIGVSRPICPECIQYLKSTGATISPGGASATWNK